MRRNWNCVNCPIDVLKCIQNRWIQRCSYNTLRKPRPPSPSLLWRKVGIDRKSTIRTRSSSLESTVSPVSTVQLNIFPKFIVANSCHDRNLHFWVVYSLSKWCATAFKLHPCQKRKSSHANFDHFRAKDSADNDNRFSIFCFQKVEFSISTHLKLSAKNSSLAPVQQHNLRAEGGITMFRYSIPPVRRMFVRRLWFGILERLCSDIWSVIVHRSLI